MARKMPRTTKKITARAISHQIKPMLNPPPVSLRYRRRRRGVDRAAQAAEMTAIFRQRQIDAVGDAAVEVTAVERARDRLPDRRRRARGK